MIFTCTGRLAHNYRFLNILIITIMELDKLPWKAFAKCITYISITKVNLPLRTPRGETVPERTESGEVRKKKKRTTT